MAKITTFTTGGAAQVYVAIASGWVRVSGKDVFVQTGVTGALQTDALYLAAPQLFAPHVVDQYTG